MVIGACEGQGWRYEIIERSEGYLVRPRDLDTGAPDEESGLLFRTCPVAFAYADMAAARDRYAAGDMTEDPEDLRSDYEARRILFQAVSRQLADDGAGEPILLAWHRRQTDRRRLH